MKNIKKIKGFQIVVENIIGSIRKGVDENGVEWSTEMKNTYGYFEGTIGSDGDEVDVFLGPSVDSNFNVYIINQDNKDGSFDEHKVMFGFKDLESARKAYYNNYEDGWDQLRNIVTMSLSNFKNWLVNKDETIHPANKKNMASETSEDEIKVIQMFGEVVEGETLENLKKQMGDINSFDTLVIEIASPGGSVSEGLEIMVWLDWLSAQGKQIITVVVANAYSIASLIMLSADMRFISKHGEVMVHNPMVPEIEYANANDLQKYVDELRGLESMMYELYQVFTGLNQEQIKSLMDKETYLSPDDSVSSGFADTVVDIKKRSFEMTANLKSDINMSKTFNMLNRVIAAVNKSDFVNQLYYTEAGGEVEIYQADPASYKIGDRVEGEDGEVQLSDGAKLVIKSGIIENIDRGAEVEAADEEAVPEEGEGAPVVEPIVEAAEEEAAPVIPVPDEDAPEAGQFNEGEAPKAPTVVEDAAPAPGKGKDEMPAKVTEVTESKTTTETVAAVEADAPVDTVTPEAVVEAAEVEAAKKPAKITDLPGKTDDDGNVIKNSVVDMDAILNRISALEAKASEAEARAEKAEAKLENTAKFEDLATKAIDSIYQNTSSSFAPEAKANVVTDYSPKSGSIFSKAKKDLGLS
jgi:ATP-dependent protease ClpP protease subunit